MTTHKSRTDEEFLAVMREAGLDPNPDNVAFLREWDELISTLDAEALDALREVLKILQEMTPAERAAYSERQRLAALTPEAARALVVAELEAGREPEGKLLGDWLQVDPALQYFFRRTMQAVWEPDTVLHLQPRGFVSAA